MMQLLGMYGQIGFFNTNAYYYYYLNQLITTNYFVDENGDNFVDEIGNKYTFQ